MPTKVLEVNFENLPQAINGLQGYGRAMVLVRIGGRPVGRVYLPVVEGTIQGRDLQNETLRNAGRVFWKYWMGQILDCPVESTPDHPRTPTSIAVCTRDRADDLQRCLQALESSVAVEDEILVIDSCSSGETTRKVVQRFPEVHYIRVERPGLDRARNRAIREARHEILAFIDDDAVPDPEWVRALSDHFYHPNVACVTGLTMPAELETVAQEKFEQYSPFGRGFERKSFERGTFHPIGAGEIGSGTNMAVRVKAMEKIGLFDEALDAGTPTYSGGETEMFSRLLAAGYRIIYEPRALNWHYHRRSMRELRRTIYGYGVGTYAFWTRKFLFEGEWLVAPVAMKWLLGDQIPRLIRSMLPRNGAPGFDLVFLEILGCFAGPWLYLKSRQQRSG